jgi:hypothetical protein
LEWDLDESSHKTAFPYKFWKFNQLKDQKPGTGTAFIPSEVKEDWQQMLAKMGGDEGGKDDAEE